MTRILQAGWETGSPSQIGLPLGVGAYPAPTVVASSPAPRSGGFCLKCGLGNAGFSGWANASRLRIDHATKTELFYAFGVYRSDVETHTFPSQIGFYTADAAGNINCCLTFEGDGSVRAYYAGSGGATPAWTLLGTSSITIPNTTWAHIEVHIIASTSTGGTFAVKIDGVSAISVTGIRTCQVSAALDVVGLQFHRGASTGDGASYIAYDDLRVNDTSGSVNNTWTGDESILALIPSAAGDSSQFSRGGADSGSNWGQVDERPPNGTTDYVYDPTVGHLDLYNTTTQTVGTVSAVEVIANAFNPDGSGGTINLVTKTAAGQSDGSAVILTGAQRFFRRLLETDPADSGAWTQAKIDALQIGPKVAS